MASRVHGNNKCRSELGIDVTHKACAGRHSPTTSGKVGEDSNYQLASIMALYHLYSRDMDVTSAFLNWWSMWRLFRGSEPPGNAQRYISGRS